MSARTDRLKRLVKLQKQIKALHETRRATHIAQAAAADDEARALLDSLNAASPLPGLFPDIYNRRIGSAIGRKEAHTVKAKEESGRVATARARTTMVENAYREASRLDERESAEREQIEALERKLTGRK
ncbi:hypothetical protein [Aquamicrobium sp. LC103]|uniref:hypothetical protein n=1 Tax=Aquamicrobium sp. LC103 TaxID=1120658 RepID=UPI00063E9013|nr:hypothetical protein [Aquamicrobium sp. LC103]TKT77507.1 hypothetical protein XW59_013635 [Aquamicrobium sp. LC103]